ncbi:WD40/YVTN repeat-like containing protein [Gracilaria domingensis]|nr:WD40/YVTN repeat-like containing protein [Gracilaria domingensis]
MKPQTIPLSNVAEGSSSVLTSTKTGKRTYADAAVRRSDRDETLPLSLQQSASLRKRHRRSVARPASSSVSRKLLRRELGEDMPSAHVSFAMQRFRNIKLQTTMDAHDADEMTPGLAWSRNRSKIVEIASSNDLVFGLTYNGVCAVFSRELNKCICFMNVSDDEVIRSLFLNKTNDSLITVSVFKTDDFSSLHCRSTPLSQIRTKYLKSGFKLFESESLRYPGFVEFDDVNGKILTFSAEDQKYKVWDLNTYKHLYTIQNQRIHEVKISPGLMLLIHERQDVHVPIRIHNIETGAKLQEINHLVRRNRKIEFIEQFHDKLLVKQIHENLQIVDVCSGKRTEVERSRFLTPNSFIFLHESEIFLTFENRRVNVWNFRGERIVVDFGDHVLYRSDSSNSLIYITQKQDIILSYCQNDSGTCSHGSINLSWIENGKLIHKISCEDIPDRKHVRALENVSAVHYNEERSEIYSGTKDGLIHVWSN